MLRSYCFHANVLFVYNMLTHALFYSNVRDRFTAIETTAEVFILASRQRIRLGELCRIKGVSGTRCIYIVKEEEFSLNNYDFKLKKKSNRIFTL